MSHRARFGLALLLLSAVLAACDTDPTGRQPLLDAGPDAEVDAGRPDFGAGPDSPPPMALEATADAFDGEVAWIARNLITGATLARDAERPMATGALSPLLVAIAWYVAVDAGTVDPTTGVLIQATDLRGVGLGTPDVGQRITLREAMDRAMLENDRGSEGLIVRALGGYEAVAAVIDGLGVPGFGPYLSPCERDRAFAVALDARFADASCNGIGQWLYRGDDTGLKPRPFVEVPEFDAAA
ncbi:MAG: serine hydrolase, partial [Myxococcales bacterium]|nr:serine hydrolase [Myxococcales bacterium]